MTEVVEPEEEGIHTHTHTHLFYYAAYAGLAFTGLFAGAQAEDSVVL
jgi:hypothetical protein